MVLGALDIATTTGLAIARGEVITAQSFRPRAQRPDGLKPGEVDFTHEGRVAREFRDHLLAWLRAEEVDVVGIEKPLVPNISYKKPIVDTTASWAGQAITYEEKGATTFGTIFRIYALVGQAVELCARLNIPVYPVPQQTWRSAFIGVTRAPKGTSNGTAWLKAQAKTQCERLGIKIANTDQADAVGVVFWLRGHIGLARRLGEFALEAPA